MERPTKRQRLFNPRESRGFYKHHEYYETPNDELEEGDGEEEEEEEEERGGYEEETERDYNPDDDLQQKRAHLDYKLKSTFESLFEKYERNFDGIGDEIDLCTGEIIVNNGHLMEMKDERDAGILSGEDSTLESETEEVINESELDELDENEEMEGDEEEDYYSDDEMVEDDMILRGFAQASQQFMRRRISPEVESYSDGFIEPSRKLKASRPSNGRDSLPSRSNIVAQFGPQLGPEIAKYIKQQGAFEDTTVEPAWRAPPLPSDKAKIRPKPKAIKTVPDIERSPSPDNGASIWATKGSKRPRFTEEEDELLLDFVAEARRRGLDLSSQMTWKQLEATHPRHGWQSWKKHYNDKFTFLTTRNVEESEVSASEVSTIPPVKQPKMKKIFRISKENPARSQKPNPAVPRSTRVRKPAQKDPNIICWSEAVPILASEDPQQYGPLVADARRTNAGASFRFSHPTPASSTFHESQVSQKGSNAVQQLNQYPNIRKPWTRPADDYEHLDEGTEDELAFTSLPKSPERVSCPHVACKNYASATYRVKRFDEEEQSPLCLHLLRVHHTTPFPCGEEECDRKGESGFFMQRDLVLHVKESHRYAAALHRLRGRVDSVLLDQGTDSRRPISSLGVPRPCTPSALPRDSDFMSRRRGEVGSSSQQHPSPGHDKTLTPRSAFPMHDITKGVEPSSLRVHPSSTTQTEAVTHSSIEEEAYDSDLQILESDPFLDRDTPTKNKKSYPCPMKDDFSCAKMFTTSSSAHAHSKVHTSEKVKCSYPACDKMISTAQPNTMKAHLKIHERDQSLPALEHTVPASKTKHTISSTIPNSQSSTAEPFSGVLIASPITIQATTKPLAPARNIVDPSYDFSDEEEFAPRPAAKQLLETTKSVVVAPTQPTEPSASKVAKRATRATDNPQIATPNIPSAKLIGLSTAKKPEQATKRTQATKASILSVVQASLVTPIVKSKAQKPLASGDSTAEDYDELSLGADGFILLASRPRKNPQAIPGSDIRVKREENVQESSELPTRKRRFSTYEGVDDIDELNAGGPQDGVMLGAQSHIKKEQEDALRLDRPILKPKKVQCKRKNREVKTSQAAGHSTPPAKNKQKLARVGTPLIDLVRNNDSSSTTVPKNGLDTTIPSTSEPGSSPTARPTRTRNQKSNTNGSPLLGLLTPSRKLAVAGTIKQEDDETLFKTPGGTLRRCGEDGLSCGKPFCFTCGSAVVGSK